MDIATDHIESMTYGDFIKAANEKQNAFFGDSEPSIDEIEDLYWNVMCSEEKLYAQNNQISLFGENVKIWNLDKFTNKESIIHSDVTHHYDTVSILKTISNHLMSEAFLEINEY